MMSDLPDMHGDMPRHNDERLSTMRSGGTMRSGISSWGRATPLWIVLFIMLILLPALSGRGRTVAIKAGMTAGVVRCPDNRLCLHVLA